MKLTLIRHGETEASRRRIYYGVTDIPVLPESLEEIAERAARGFYPEAELYFTSGLLRTEQTFRAIYGETPHVALPGLREINLGDFEMRSYEELKEDPAFIEWITGDNEANVCPNGESGNEVTRRALDALEPVIRGDRDAVAITHGGVIGGVLAHWFPSELGRYAFTPGGGEGYVVLIEHGKPVGIIQEIKA